MSIAFMKSLSSVAVPALLPQPDSISTGEMGGQPGQQNGLPVARNTKAESSPVGTSPDRTVALTQAQAAVHKALPALVLKSSPGGASESPVRQVTLTDFTTVAGDKRMKPIIVPSLTMPSSSTAAGAAQLH